MSSKLIKIKTFKDKAKPIKIYCIQNNPSEEKLVQITPQVTKSRQFHRKLGQLNPNKDKLL